MTFFPLLYSSRRKPSICFTRSKSIATRYYCDTFIYTKFDSTLQMKLLQLIIIMLSLNNRAKCSLLARQCSGQFSFIHTGMSSSCHILCSSNSRIQRHQASSQQQNPSVQQKRTQIMDNICTELFFVKISLAASLVSPCFVLFSLFTIYKTVFVSIQEFYHFCTSLPIPLGLMSKSLWAAPKC